MYRRGEVGQVARALRVLDALRGFRHGRLLSEIATDAGVSERTVRRDLTELQEAGFEIEFPRLAGRAAARVIEHSHSHIAITRRERYTLLAVRAMFDVLRGTPLWEDVASVLRKLEQRMNPAERAEHETFGDRFAYVPDGGTKAYEGKEDILDALLTGVLSRKVVRYEYRDARGRSQRGHLAPFAMVLYKHGLYVIGRRLRHPADGKSITDATNLGRFAVERFTDAEHLRTAPFTPPPGFKVADVLHGAFGLHTGDTAERVVIEFSKAKAAYVRGRLWHPTQRFEALPDGRTRLEFTCSDLTPVVSWVLEWGPHARAVEPLDLVTAIRAELVAALENYPEP